MNENFFFTAVFVIILRRKKNKNNIGSIIGKMVAEFLVSSSALVLRQLSPKQNL